jgi:hypothetical protein
MSGLGTEPTPDSQRRGSNPRIGASFLSSSGFGLQKLKPACVGAPRAEAYSARRRRERRQCPRYPLLPRLRTSVLCLARRRSLRAAECRLRDGPLRRPVGPAPRTAEVSHDPGWQATKVSLGRFLDRF